MIDYFTISASGLAIAISCLSIGGSIINLIWMKSIDRRRRERLGYD